MNEIEKAKNQLINLKNWLDNNKEHEGESIEAIDVALHALEKQIPKNPIIKSWSPARCPYCNSELSDNMGDGYYKHWESLKVCECGQKLDWSEVENE